MEPMSSAPSSMTSADLVADPVGNLSRTEDGTRRPRWLLIIAFLIIAIPTLINLARETWTTEAGAHGPLVLATGLWLLWSRSGLADSNSITHPPFSNLLLLIVALMAYVFGRAYDLLVLEAGGLHAVGLVLCAQYIGWRSLIGNVFPYSYMAFLVPIPGWALAYLTAPLQHLVSAASTSALRMLDYPVFREGVVITVAQYQLLVEDACAGMNSLMGLISVSMFYIYVLHRASWRHAGLLLLCIIPIAIIVNIVRVTILILLTFHYGDAVAQGFMHMTAGMVLFGFALALMVLADNGIRALFHRMSAKELR